MPFRIDLDTAPDDAPDRLIEFGALDVDAGDGRCAAIVPDDVRVSALATALGVPPEEMRVSPVEGRDDGSVWILRPRPAQVGRIRIVPADWPASTDALRLADGPAFGTGLHPTTVLCLEAIELELSGSVPAAVLDIGTGTGILALAALRSGVERAIGIDLEPHAVAAAAHNAAINGLRARLQLVRCGPEAIAGRWPLVLANILAAPLIAMAPGIAALVGRRGRLVLSGVRASLAPEVAQAYRRCGMHVSAEHARDGWSALTLRASW